MSEQAAALGLPVAHFEWQGKRYPLRPPDFHAEALMATWLEDRGLSAMHRHARKLGIALDAAVAAWARDVAAGKYEWESDTAREAWSLVGSRGWRQWCWLLLNQSDTTATPEMVDEVCEAGPEHAKRLDEARAVACDPLARGRPGSASPSPPSSAA